MTHIGKKIILIPENVNVILNLNIITITGKYGTLNQVILPLVNIIINQNNIQILALNKDKKTNAYHGLIHTLICNMIKGVNETFKKELKMEGVGFKFQLNNNILTLSIGFSHKINILVPLFIKIILESPTHLIITGINKEQVGLFTAKIRNYKKPEPYKGKGILYLNEIIKKKIGKKGK